MNSFLKNLMGLTIIIYSLVSSAQAKEIMAILSDNLRPVSTNYIIYPETSNLIAQDIANRININSRIKALPVCNTTNNAQKKAINREVQQFAKEYQYTYNLNYNILRKIADKIGADYILLISSSIDIESNFLKETLWNKIPISGENSINPSYRVVTQITLVDPNNELILLEKNYNKDIASKDFDLAMPTFSPSSGQLDKFKNYSQRIAKSATPLIETEIVPELMPVKRTFIDKVKYNYDSYMNKDAINLKPQTQAQTQIPENSDINLKTNPNVKLYNYVYDNL